MTENERLDKYLEIKPNNKQKTLQKMGFYVFFHFGMNTFTGKEWGDGKTPPEVFAPSALDTDQWCAAIKAAGAKGAIITAKHHDGFCLWQTDTTEYSVKNSPYKDGKGDIVAELRRSCDKYGLKLGVYLSPWDRNSEFYGTEKYDDFYIAQLTELLTGYGELFCVWLDGACGSYMDGKPVQKYDFPRYYAKINELQPNCAISNCGPDIRWVGNEGGICRESEWNVVPTFAVDTQTIMKHSQQTDGTFKRIAADIVSEDLGSREFLKNFDDFMWYPAEVDVSVRPGWFYHKSQDKSVRSVNNLLNIYYNSVGGNSLLLLNIPPDKRGLLCEVDVKRLKTFGDKLSGAFSKPVKTELVSQSAKGFSGESALNGKSGCFSPVGKDGKFRIELKFETTKIDKIRLRENTDFSQRTEAFRVSVTRGGKEKIIARGTVIGFNKLVFFKPIVTDNLAITIEKCRREPYFEAVEVFEENGGRARSNPFAKVVKYFHQLSYKMYCKKFEKAKDKNKAE